jgi:hypothetical protein
MTHVLGPAGRSDAVFFLAWSDTHRRSVLYTRTLRTPRWSFRLFGTILFILSLGWLGWVALTLSTPNVCIYKSYGGGGGGVFTCYVMLVCRATFLFLWGPAGLYAWKWRWREEGDWLASPMLVDTVLLLPFFFSRAYITKRHVCVFLAMLG